MLIRTGRDAEGEYVHLGPNFPGIFNVSFDPRDRGHPLTGASAKLDRLEADLEEQDADSSSGSQSDARMELSGCLRPMLNRLSADYREAIRLVELEGLTHQEAATKLGLSLPGMKSRVQRGRRQLRKLLDDCCLIELDNRRGVAGYELRSSKDRPSC